jgi:type I restriction-modification system DNA methylase subunit/predicted DNA-binding transcriptional regulator AlpA
MRIKQNEQGPLVSLADIARMAGVGRPAVSNWRQRYDDFPKPVQETGAASLFRQADIERWMRRHRKPFVIPSVEQQVWSAFAVVRGAVLPEDAAHAAMMLLGSAAIADRMGAADREVLDDALRKWHSEALANELERLMHRAAWLGLHDAAGVDAILIRSCLPFLWSIDDLARQHGAGQVFEALLAMIGRSSRNGWEHSSPPPIANLVASLAEPIRGTVYDPACGRGGFLYAAYQRVEPGARVRLVGREISSTAYRVAQFRLLIHGIDAVISLGDTLTSGARIDPPVDVVLADPPFGMSWQSDRASIADDLPFGVPPRSRADLAWLQHSITQLRPTGMGFHVTTLGPLFRTGAEAHIRRALVMGGLVHAVIALPPGLYGPQTRIPVAIWIVGRQRTPAGHSILVVDATRMGRRLRGRTDLSEEEITTVVERYRAWRDASRSGKAIADTDDGELRHRTIGIDSIVDHDCNLNPARWFKDQAPDARQDIGAVRAAETRLQTTRDALARAAQLDLSALMTSDHDVSSMSIREMIDQRLLKVVRARRVDPSLVGSGDTPLIRSHDLGDDWSVMSSAGIDPSLLGHEPVTTEPGDVIVLATGARPRAAVDSSGGAVMAAPLYLLRWSAPGIDPLVMAALITRSVQGHSAGITRPQATIYSLQLPILDAESSKWLGKALRALVEQRRLASLLADTTRDLADRLIDALGSGRACAQVPTQAGDPP